MVRRALPRLVLVVGVAVVAVACGARAPSPVPATSSPGGPASSAPSGLVWPAPPEPMERTVAAGLKPQPKEFLDYHVHAHLDVFVNGEPVIVPAGIGIAIDDPEVKTFTLPDGSLSYGGIEFCDRACISPLHTHDASGILHTETASTVPNTLGEFFVEWGVPLSATCVGDPCQPGPVAFYVNGEPYTGDPATIGLTDRTEIAVVLGTPPATIPSTADWSNA